MSILEYFTILNMIPFTNFHSWMYTILIQFSVLLSQ